jgi:hypothetical protein
MEILNQFFDYLKTPLNHTLVGDLYRKHNITHIRMHKYGEFIISLLQTCFDTYMGDDVTDHEGRIKHFNWCWNKTVSDFRVENTYFGVNLEIKNYFKEFIFEVFYNVENKLDNIINQKKMILFWQRIFDINSPKTKADMDCLISVYSMFESSISEKLTLTT